MTIRLTTVLCCLLLPGVVTAQEPPPAPDGDIPPPQTPPAAEEPAPAQPEPSQDAPPQPPPAQPAPAPQPLQPTPPQPGPVQPAPVQPAPAPQQPPPGQPAAQPSAPPPERRYAPEEGYAYTPAPNDPAYADDYDANDGAGEGDGSGDFEIPDFSIRLDPFNWLIAGRLGLELEVELWKFMSFELVPVFVANEEPPSFNFSGRDDPVSQHSNGLGPISGTSLGIGFWLNGKPFRGYALRVLLTNYGYEYRASDSQGVFDKVKFTERRLVFMFSSYSVFGNIFTIGGGIGLGYELNQVERCQLTDGAVNSPTGIDANHSGCDGEQHIALDRNAAEVADLNGFLHPVYLEGRFSLGFIF